MKVSSGVGLLILVLVTIICIGLLLAGGWAYMRLEPVLADQKLHAEMTRLRSAAPVYRDRMSNYEGVCREIGVRPGYDCNDSTVAFAISVERQDGSFYCLDSTGYFETQVMPIREFLSCQPNGQ